jgi:hypothetical protein
MSVFGSIMSSIFGAGKATSAPAAAPHAVVGAHVAANAPGTAPAAEAPVTPPAKAPTTPPAGPVDVAGIMDKLAEATSEDLDWRKSIVDLMKLLNLDSSLAARRQLAAELNYTGSTKDTAAMNIWLHKQVMLKLAENGGKVPADLKH